MAYYVKKVEDEHSAHAEHEKHEHPDAEIGTPAYSWLNKRAKPFPWGYNSLFFNPEVRFLTSDLPTSMIACLSYT